MRPLILLLAGLLLSACATAPGSDENGRSTSNSSERSASEAKSKAAASKNKKDAKASAPKPEPTMVQIKVDSGNGRFRTETRPMFSIEVSKKRLSLNRTPVKDLEALQQILAGYRGLVLTVAAHRCLESERAAEVMSLAQRYTSVSVTYGSFGDYGDEQCE